MLSCRKEMDASFMLNRRSGWALNLGRSGFENVTLNYKDNRSATMRPIAAKMMCLRDIQGAENTKCWLKGNAIL